MTKKNAESLSRPPWSVVRALLDDVRVDLLFPFAGVSGDLPTHYALALGKYVHAVRLFEAAKVLLLDGLPGPAAMLGRSLTTEALHLMELAASPDDRRAALILGWSNLSLSREFELLRKAEVLGLGSADAARAKLEERRKKLVSHQQRRGLPRLERCPLPH